MEMYSSGTGTGVPHSRHLLLFVRSPRGSSRRLYVNLFVSSTVAYANAGVALVQTAAFPVSNTSTTTLTIAPIDAADAQRSDASSSKVCDATARYSS